MRLSLPTALLIIFGAAAASAQTGAPRTLVGTVVDGSSGEPLVGATVRVLAGADSLAATGLVATKLGAITAADGRFTLRLPADAAYVLEISSIGYSTARRTLAASDTAIAVELSERSLLSQQVQVRAARRTRSVEDACCRVESIREEVQQHAPFSPSAVDVLRRYSSCTSTRVICALDNSQSIRLRGLEPTYINVLVDGMPAVSGLGTGYALGMIPAHALQTIRISEGASSGLYGNGAISGVVDLETRQPTEMPELSVSANLAGHGFEAPGAQDVNVAYTGLVGDVGLAAFGSFNNHGGELGGGLPGDYQRLSGLVKGNVLIDGATEVTVSVLGGRERREGALHGELEATESVRSDRADVALKIAHTLEDESELEARALLSLGGIDASYIGRPLDAAQRIGYASLAHRRDIGSHALTLGAEIRDDELSVASGPAIGYRTTVASAFLQDELILDDLWTVMASTRVDHHDDAGTIVSPRGSIRFEPITNMTMRLMAGTGFKGQAHFDEVSHAALHGDLRWSPNTALDFERSFTLNYDISYSFMLGETFGVDANFNAYHTMIEGKAVPHADSLAAGAIHMVNSGEPARLRGIEVQLRPSLGEHWSGSLAFAVIDYRMRATSGEYERIELAPSLNVDASIMYHEREAGLTAEVWGSLVGAQRLPSNPYGLEESPAYTLLNARAEKAFGAVAVFAGLNNILDSRQTRTMPLAYAGETGITTAAVWGPMEGRELFLGVRYTLGGSVE